MKVQRSKRGRPRKKEQQPLCEIQRESNRQAGKSKPIKPNSAYQQFFKEEKQKINESGAATSLAKRAVVKQIGLKWRSLDPATRSWYDVNARDQVIQYEIELAHWEMEEQKKKQSSPPTAIPLQVARAVVAPSPTTVAALPAQQQHISSPSPLRSTGQEEDLPEFMNTCYSPTSPPSRHLISSISTVVSCDDFPKMWHDVKNDTLCQTSTPHKDENENDAKLQARINLSLLQNQSFSDNDFVDFMTSIQFS